MGSDSKGIMKTHSPAPQPEVPFPVLSDSHPTSAFHPATTEFTGSTWGLPNQGENYFDKHMHSKLQFTKSKNMQDNL